MKGHICGSGTVSLAITGDFGRVVPLIIFGTSMVVAGLLALLLPETLNRNLPETINDAKNMTRRTPRTDKLQVDYVRSEEEEMMQLNDSSRQDHTVT